MKIWIRQHLSACSTALKQISVAPGNFIFNILVVAVALSLPIIGLTLIENTRPLSNQLAIEPELSLFLKSDISRDKAVALEDTIQQAINNVSLQAKVVLVPRETALDSLQKGSNIGDVLATLGGNPLPDVYVLSFKQNFKQPISDKIESLAKQLRGLPEVDNVQIDSNWIKRLSALINLAQFVLVAMAIALGVVVITVVFNATRLQVLAQSAEIAVIRLLGATNQYICRPYYYTGVFLGLLAGVTALVLAALTLHPLNNAILEFASLYGSEFQLRPLNFTFSIYLLITSALLGLFGAFLSVRHQAR